MNRLLFQRNWGIPAALVFWAGVIAANVTGLGAAVQFRGIRFTGGDFGQYYMGGVVANTGIWDDLYPVDLATTPSPDKSAVAPELAAELSKRGADISWKYIYPPSLAVFFAPLDWFPHTVSKRVFTTLLFGSVIWFLVLFRRECDDWNLPPFLANLLVLLVGTGLPVSESVLMANATPFVALASILALRSLRANHVTGAVFSFALAGLFKGVSAVWIPILFLRRRWKILLAGILAGIAILALPHFLGASPALWETFLRDVVPGSRKLYWIGDGNLGLPSFLAWCSGGCLSEPLSRMLQIAQFATLLFAYAFAWRTPAKESARAEGLALFLATLTFQLFSPICWPHYAFNIVGFLPLCLAVAGVRKGCRLRGRQWISPLVLAIASFLVWYPIGNAAKAVFHVPLLGFGRTAGYLMMLGWGLWALPRHAKGAEAHAPAED